MMALTGLFRPTSCRKIVGKGIELQVFADLPLYPFIPLSLYPFIPLSLYPFIENLKTDLK